MNTLPCTTIQERFSAYLDGAISGHEMREISDHINGFEAADGGSGDGCGACARELQAWRSMQREVCTLGPAKAPADLGLRLRVSISREQARRNSRFVDRFSLAWDNAVGPLLVQISAGFAGAVVLVGSIALLLGVVAAPQTVLANDEPLGAVTAPHYLYSMVAPNSMVTAHGAAVVVQASVDTSGRVYDFTIVSGPDDQTVRTRVAEQLLSSVFAPASAFGVPIRGQVIVTFSGISVRA